MSYSPERVPGIRAEPVTHTCPECGTVNPRSAGACWLCRAPLLEGGELHVGHLDSPETNARKSVTAWTTFVLLCGLVALLGGALIFTGENMALAAGVLFLILTIPILVQIARAALLASQDSRALSFGQSFGAVLLGVAIAIAMVVATWVMFVVTCLPIGLATFNLHGRSGDTGLIVAIVIGMIAGGGMAYLLTWAIFRRKKKTDRSA